LQEIYTHLSTHSIFLKVADINEKSYMDNDYKNYATQYENRFEVLEQPPPSIIQDINFIIYELLFKINTLMNMRHLKEAMDKMAFVY
jgi:hypothetical protein